MVVAMTLILEPSLVESCVMTKGIFIASFSDFIPGSFDILLAELSAIYHGLIMAKDLGYT